MVLKLTNDPLALGTVLALEGLPRAVLMLFGGAVTDRLSPRLMMLIANVTRFLLTALMAFVVLTGVTQLWMVYLFGLLFGTVAGFAISAETSIVPILAEEEDLQAGNSIMMGITQLAGFVGPTIAGILIGQFSGTYEGAGIAFGFDAFTFVVSAITLQLIRTGASNESPAPSPDGTPDTPSKESVWMSIQAGLRYMWTDKTLRLMFLVLMAINFLFIGPIMVGIPVLASQRLSEGARAFGLLMSAFAGGNLIGYLVSGSLRRPSGGGMQLIVTLVLAGFGVVIGVLGLISSTWIDFALLFVLGLGNGYLAIIVITWVQTRTPKEMLGRIMSLLMLSGTGLMPISQALAGTLSKVDLTLLFVAPGVLVLIVTAAMAVNPEFKRFATSLTAAQTAAHAES